MKFAVALLLLLSAHLVSALVCQDGWQIFQDNCYQFVNSKVRYWTASADCNLKHARLLMIQNAEVNTWIVEQINNHSIEDLWTGALRETNKWEWMPNREPITYFNWAPGEPIYSWYHKCIVIFPAPSHKWNDANCRHSAAFACQKPATSVQEPSSSTRPYTTSVQEPSSSTRPYTSIEWKPFQNYVYTIYTEPKTWEAAQATCAQNQAHLAVVKKPEVHKWLAAQIKMHSMKELWIGGRYVASGTYWEWNPSGDRFFYGNLNWVVAQPSEIGWGECLSLPSFAKKFRWNETPCSANQTFACQKPASIEREQFQEQFQDYVYTFYTEPKTWEAAQATCAQNQAHLAVVKTPEVHKWLAAQIKMHSMKELWIGNRYLTDGGYWEWNPSGDLFDDGNLNWVVVEPSEIGWGECLSLPSFVKKFRWNETPCSAKQTFACQKPA